MGFPNQPISMCFHGGEGPAPLPPFYRPIDGLRTAFWVGNFEFGGYPDVGANWTSRPDVEAYAAQLPKRGDWAAVIDVEQWDIGGFAGASGASDVTEVLTNVTAWIRPYAVGPMLLGFFFAGTSGIGYPSDVASLLEGDFTSAWLNPSPTGTDLANRDLIADWFSQQRPIYELAGCAMAHIAADYSSHLDGHLTHLQATRRMLDQLAPDLDLYVWTSGHWYSDPGEPEMQPQEINLILNAIDAARGTPAIWGDLERSGAMLRAIQDTIF